jgi:cardiolipin synthase
MQSEVNQEENLNRIITVPNLLSFFRLCLIPVIIWSYCVKKNPLLAGEILLLSGLTDLADGYIARLTQAAMLICLFTRFPHVLLLIVIMAGKELYMVVSGCLVIRKTGKVHGADWHGKIVTFLLYGTAAVHIIWFHITPMVSDLLIGLCAIMMVISVALYIIQNTRTLKGETV